jgi:hypothetical protein
MSKLSEERQEEAAQKTGPDWAVLVIGLIVLLLAWGGYAYYHHRKFRQLQAFAHCLNASGTRMYGAWWCPHCADQKEEFGSAFEYVNYTECSPEGKRTTNEQCKQAGIKRFPTWQFADGARIEGVLPLSRLSQRSGCKLP